jgi:PAS domain S-box-containing protein
VEALGEFASGSLLGAIFSASPDVVVVIDEERTIVLTSPAMAELFGYAPDELVGAPVEILVPEIDRDDHVAHVGSFFQTPHPRLMGVGRELSGRRRDGSEIAVDVSLTPVEIDGVRYAAAFVRDARERRRNADRLRAINDITQALLGGTPLEGILPLITERARSLTRSDAVWIVTPNASGSLVIAAAHGPGTEVLVGVELSAETSRSAAVMRSGAPEIIADLSTAQNVPAAVVDLRLGPGVYVPLVAGAMALGALVLGRVRGSSSFDALEVAFAEVFASSTTAVIELGEARSELERPSIISEDERIARDLHDTVIQRLFAVGMSLQAARSRATGSVGERIDAAVDDLDGVIREIRNTIFRLPGRAAAGDLRTAMLAVVETFTGDLGFTPRIAFDGPVEASVPDGVRGNSWSCSPRRSRTPCATRTRRGSRSSSSLATAGCASRSSTTASGSRTCRGRDRGCGTSPSVPSPSADRARSPLGSRAAPWSSGRFRSDVHAGRRNGMSTGSPEAPKGAVVLWARAAPLGMIAPWRSPSPFDACVRCRSRSASTDLPRCRTATSREPISDCRSSCPCRSSRRAPGWRSGRCSMRCRRSRPGWWPSEQERWRTGRPKSGWSRCAG